MYFTSTGGVLNTQSFTTGVGVVVSAQIVQVQLKYSSSVSVPILNHVQLVQLLSYWLDSLDTQYQYRYWYWYTTTLNTNIITPWRVQALKGNQKPTQRSRLLPPSCGPAVVQVGGAFWTTHRMIRGQNLQVGRNYQLSVGQPAESASKKIKENKERK